MDTAFRFTMFRRLWAGFGLCLFAVTWKLWSPQTEFPQIPFFEFLVNVPGFIDWIAVGMVGGSLFVCLLAKSERHARLACSSFAMAACVLILLNQHRLQPWAYQFAIFGLIMSLASSKSAFFLMRMIVVSIYVYSAISKLDYQFVHTVGDQMLWTLTNLIGVDSHQWSREWRQALVLGMPITELLIGIGLMIPQSRRLAAVVAVLLHLLLLLALFWTVDGAGVLVWNVFFVAQAILLFGWDDAANVAANQTFDEPRYRFEVLASVLALFVILFPLTRQLGICDHWPAWEVYAPRTSRARIVGMEQSDQPLLSDASSFSSKRLGAPIYPERRFQLAVAMAVLEKYDLKRQVEISGISDRWTGARNTETLTQRDQMEMRASEYWLNTKPRTIWRN